MYILKTQPYYSLHSIYDDRTLVTVSEREPIICHDQHFEQSQYSEKFRQYDLWFHASSTINCIVYPISRFPNCIVYSISFTKPTEPVCGLHWNCAERTLVAVSERDSMIWSAVWTRSVFPKQRWLWIVIPEFQWQHAVWSSGAFQRYHILGSPNPTPDR